MSLMPTTGTYVLSTHTQYLQKLNLPDTIMPIPGHGFLVFPRDH